MRDCHLERVICSALAATMVAAGLSVAAWADSCPTSTLTVTQEPPEEIAGPSASGTRTDFYSGFTAFYFREYGDSVHLAFQVGESVGASDFTVRGRYRFLGAAPGSTVSAQVRVHVAGTLYGVGGDPLCQNARASFSLLEDGTSVGSSEWLGERAPPNYDNCYRAFGSTVNFTCAHTVGTEFELSQYVQLSLPQGFDERGDVATRLAFGLLPPETFLVRCDGDTAVPVLGVGAEPHASLRIDAIRPNPSDGDFRASLYVTTGGSAIVRLLDVSGRTVESRVWDAPAATRREMSFGRSLAPGIYFLKLSQGAVSAVREVVVRR